MDETGIEVLFYTIIKATDMKKEFIDNKWVSFGEYNFTGLDVSSGFVDVCVSQRYTIKKAN